MADTGRFSPVEGALTLPKQHFTGNPLDRLSDIRKRFEASASTEGEVSLVVVAGREVVVRPAPSGHMPGVLQELQALLLRTDDPELALAAEEMFLNWRPSDDAEPIPFPLYLLGQDLSNRWTFALDISGHGKELFLEFLASMCELDVVMRDLRVLLPGLSLDAVAIAGQATALSSWHQTHHFCPRCGAETVATEAGSRRRCIRERSHKQYPRTDPVVIMLVESPDGNRALLGRSAKSTPGMYTCLSGFIDQCESIEEAVRREVMEEARVQVDEVRILGTQPWPIGRWGSCELMIGCICKARSYELMMNPQEMEDVQWYDRDELLAAIRSYDRAPAMPLQEIQKRSWSNLGFFVPPPFAIAHHLMKVWTSRRDSWFDSTAATSVAEASSDGGYTDPEAGANGSKDGNVRHSGSSIKEPQANGAAGGGHIKSSAL